MIRVVFMWTPFNPTRAATVHNSLDRGQQHESPVDRVLHHVQVLRGPEAGLHRRNMMSTALALNDFLFMFTGLHAGEDLGPRSYPEGPR